MTDHDLRVPASARARVPQGYTIDHDVRAAWNARADAEEHVVATPAFERMRDALPQRAVPGSADIALDLRCGTGLVALSAARSCARVSTPKASGTA